MNFKSHLLTYLDEKFVEDLLENINEERTYSLILNTSKISNKTFKEKFPLAEPHPFIKNAYYYSPNNYQFGKNYLFDNGAYYLMDASSLLVSHFLNIEDDDLILDMCAAPGGKTISCALKNKNAKFISNDLSYQRSLVLSSNIEKIGLANVIVCNNDFSKIYTNYHETFSKIILDVPCSGSAMFRKNELAEYDWNIQKVNSLTVRQLELIEEASYMLQKGGIISYSTCSFSFEENEGVILEFLKRHPEFKTININNNDSFYSTNELKDAIHLFPNKYRGEGQFICLLQKDGNSLNSGKKVKKSFKNADYDDKFSLDFLNKVIINNEIFEHNFDIKLSNLKIIRPGLHVGSLNKNNFIPDFHLAHFLDSSNSINLNDDQLKKYLHGDTLQVDISNGFYVVSFENINLGFVKVVNKIAKNYYPKGLRH